MGNRIELNPTNVNIDNNKMNDIHGLFIQLNILFVIIRLFVEYYSREKKSK